MSVIELDEEEIKLLFSITRKMDKGGFLPFFCNGKAALFTFLEDEAALDCCEDFLKRKERGVFKLFNYCIARMIYEMLDMVNIDERTIKSMESDFIKIFELYALKNMKPATDKIN